MIDHRNVDYIIIIGNTAAFNNRPKGFRASGAVFGIKIAEIIRPEHLGHFKVLETIFEELGYTLSVIRKKGQALAWLSAEE